ncbi:MAG TPA: TonB-dependent receptor [Thermoanaerobaculia bacterium]|nr:TonB-dependent receptor [Thermoanaerobaculia bacterium]
MRIPRFIVFLRLAAAALLLLPALPLLAQPFCSEALEAAEKSYGLGLFEDIPGQLEPCLKGRPSRAEIIQAQALLAKSYLALDELAKARDAVSALLRTDPAFEPGPPPQFAELVRKVRREEATVQVASVSKTNENVREAPATVLVLTAEEIERRGYLDLEEMLHDLPGFDISRGNGEAYSNFYQRGFRSNLNDRNLLLVDGVEQNDLSSNIVYLSRQYPLSNIERVEMVYGPASTMYGANAYTGVIHILTKEPEALLTEGKRFGYRAEAGGGTFDTQFADLALAGRSRSGNVDWSLAGRVFRSDENDLSGEIDWDYDFSNISDTEYRDAMRLLGPLAQDFCRQGMICEAENPFFHVIRDQEQGVVAIVPSDYTVAEARRLDQEALDLFHLGFADRTKDWSLSAKLRISNLTFGLQRWHNEEGTAPWTTELTRPGEGSVWAPDHTSIYFKYASSVGRNLSLQAFTRYIQSSLDRTNSQIVIFNNYANYLLRINNFVNPCSPQNEPPSPCLPWVEVISYGQLSSQLKSEATLVYSPSERLSAVGGLELRKGSIQREPDTIHTSLNNRPTPSPLANKDVEAESIEHTDVALFAQASYRPWKPLKVVLAGRVDYNEINNYYYLNVRNQRTKASGFGALFTPRAALIYTPAGSPFVFKAIYSEAFKDPTDFEKFGTIPFIRDRVSEGLRPERVRNFELAGEWQPGERFSLGISAYQAHYRDVVGSRQVPGCAPSAENGGCSQLINRGELRIRGVEASARYSAGGMDFFGNYTYTEPFDTKPELAPTHPATGLPVYDPPLDADEIRIGDIASHRVNVGLEVEPLRRLIANFRVSYVGTRKTGAGTTVYLSTYREIKDYLVPKLALTWRNLIRGTDLQLVVNNPFDAKYYHPGVQTAGFGFASRLPQPGRTVMLRLLTGGQPRKVDR